MANPAYAVKPTGSVLRPEPWSVAAQTPTIESLNAQKASIVPGTDILGRGAQIDQGIQAIQTADRYKVLDKELTDAGYTGFRTQFGNIGQWSEEGVPGWDEYNAVLDYGKKTGDWSYMEKFQDAAQYGSRKYHRKGLFGTGIRLSPLDVFLLGAGGFAGAGGFGDLGGLIGGAKGSTNAASNAFSGVSGYNSGSAFAAPLSKGSVLSAPAMGVGIPATTGNAVNYAKSILKTLSAVDTLLPNAPGQANTAATALPKAAPTEKELPSQANDKANQRAMPVQQRNTSRNVARRYARYAGRGRTGSVLSS